MAHSMFKKPGILLAGAFLLVYLAPLGLRPFIAPDEPRYAEIPREMRASGDWVVPRLNGLLYFEKPVLGYWLNAVSQTVFGETRFAVRLPSALAAGLSVLSILLLLGRRKAEERRIAEIAGALFLICPLVFGCGTFAVLDGPFSAFFTLAMALFFRGNMAESPREKRLFYAAFGVASGLAFLTKGFLGLALPVIVIVPYMLWRRQFSELLRFPWLPLLLATAVALPWALAIHLRDSDYWRFFIWHEHFQRFFEPTGSAQHPKPFWFFGPILLGGAFPLLGLLPAAIAGLRKSCKEPLVGFCLLWSALVFAFFSTSGGKLGTYILPCFPPLATLVALGTYRYLQSGQARLFQAGARGMGGLLLIGLLGVAALQTLPFPAEWRIFSLIETGRWLLASLALLAWTVIVFQSMRGASPLRKLALYAVAPALALAVFPGTLPDHALAGHAPESILERNAARVRPESLLMTSPNLAGALGWQYQRTDVMLARSPGELAYGLNRAPDDRRLVPLEEVAGFVSAQAGTGRLILFLKESRYDAHTNELPPPLYLDKGFGFVFAQY